MLSMKLQEVIKLSQYIWGFFFLSDDKSDKLILANGQS